MAEVTRTRDPSLYGADSSDRWCGRRPLWLELASRGRLHTVREVARSTGASVGTTAAIRKKSMAN